MLNIATSGCELPDTPFNGYYQRKSHQLTNGFNFFCKQDFQLQGNQSTVCKRDGTWSKPSPTCVRSRLSIFQYIVLFNKRYFRACHCLLLLVPYVIKTYLFKKLTRNVEQMVRTKIHGMGRVRIVLLLVCNVFIFRPSCIENAWKL